MTLSSLAQKFESHVPAENERAAANLLRTEIAKRVSVDSGDAIIPIIGKDGQNIEIPLPADMSKTLLNLLRMISMGDAVTLIPQSEMLTTQRAADFLNISRPYFIKLLESGEIPHQKVGRHRRVRALDVFEYSNNRDAARRAALDELATLNDDLD